MVLFLRYSNLFSGVNNSARERIGRQNLSKKVPLQKGVFALIFFFLLFWEMQGKPTKMQGFSVPSKPLKSLEKKGKTPKKARKSSKAKSKEIQKNKAKKIRVEVTFSPKNYRENAHSKSANFEGRHSGGHLLGRPLLFTSEFFFVSS